MASFCSALEYDEQPVFMPDQFYELMVYSEWRQDPDSWVGLYLNFFFFFFFRLKAFKVYI